MRILVNGWFLDQLATGSGQYLTALAEWLPRVDAAHDFILVCPGPVARSVQAANLPSHFTVQDSRFTHRLARLSPNLAKLWFEQIAFPAACRRLRADVAFVPYWGSPWWAPCPVAVTIHDLIPLLLPAYRGGLAQRAYTWLVSRTARRAAAVLTDSEASKRDIIAHLGIPAGRIHAIHLAADPHYRPVTDPATQAQVRAKYKLPPGPFLLYLGGFDVRKNLTRTISAYARLLDRLTQAGAARPLPALVIAGKAPATGSAFAPDPRPVAERLGVTPQVHFTGWVDEADKPALYALATATLFVSEYEGFGLPVLEAMASEIAPG